MPRCRPRARPPRARSSRPPAACCKRPAMRRWRADRARSRQPWPRLRAAARVSARRGRARPRSPCRCARAPAARAMRRVRLRSRRKCWPRRLRASRPCARWSRAAAASAGDRRHHRIGRQLPRRQAMSFAMARAARRLDRIGAPGPGDVERRAVIRRRPNEGQAQRHVDAAGEVHRLDRDQRLVVDTCRARRRTCCVRQHETACRPARDRVRRCPRASATSTAGSMMRCSSSPIERPARRHAD